MAKKGVNTNLEIIAVVAIVAIVAIFVLFLNAGHACKGKYTGDFHKDTFSKSGVSEKVAPEGIADEATVEPAGSGITGAVVGLPSTSWGGLQLPKPPVAPGAPPLS
jgi:hypothetical protein|tara:strand:+ start:181 stop:498 length:318 start_codon:yes stop_codon:yes gene_type:complete